jgi:hypothetical protein
MREESATTETLIRPAVAVALALEELHRLKAVERLPQPEALLAGMEGRTRDFDLLAGVAAAYLKARGVAHA